MSPFSDQFNKQTKQIRLQAAEKRALHDRLVSYMEYHPLPSSMQSPSEVQQEAQSQFSLVANAFKTISLQHKLVGRFVVTASLFLMVGVPVLAERALPGDVLYPMKVQINEEVRASLSFSPYAKIEWETTRLERRLAEARSLASVGRLTNEAEAAVVKAVKKHTSSAQENIAMLGSHNENEAALASISLVSVLQAQDDIFALEDAREVSEAGVVESSAPSLIASAVREAKFTAEAVNDQAQVTPVRLLALIERESTYAQELFIVVKKTATTEEQAAIERRLADIKRKVTDVQVVIAESTPVPDVISDSREEVPMTMLSVGAGEIASTSQKAIIESDQDPVFILKSALTDLRKLINFMTNIDVRQSVSVERLVPISYTVEERKEAVTEKLSEINTIYNDVVRRQSPVAVSEKVKQGIVSYEQYINDINLSFEEGNIRLAEVLVVEAANLIIDVQSMVGDSPLIDTEDTGVSTTSNSEIVE
jgi:hypothetical protein